ncbi:putative ABC multidrug transporter [Violaceomyces palustris]|uniref:ABC multidrug transporter n=1 Tax=Violaceomyces palustris TaxID=1673888 RepID=A0ACD0NUQ0_9BASI|nr:putative ABC multidrug transporter [Violaceomyces palustris]
MLASSDPGTEIKIQLDPDSKRPSAYQVDAQLEKTRSKTEPEELGEKGKDVGQEGSPVSFGRIFAFAKRRHMILNLIGLVAACGAGVAQPLMTIFIGRISTYFLRYSNAVESGNHQAFQQARVELDHNIRQDALVLVYLAIAMFFAVSTFADENMALWSYTAEKICTRIREAYLRSILRQEIAFFDDFGPGEIASRIRTDIHLIQGGISEKVPTSVMYLATFVSAFAVAFSRSWRLSLVLLPITPCIFLTGAVMSVVTRKAKEVELEGTAKGASRAEEVFSSIRTAKAFGKESVMLKQYDDCNEQTTIQGAKIGTLQGIGVGCLLFIIYSGYALAFFYGSKLIARGNIAAGDIISVIFSNFIGAFAIGNLFPNFEAFSMALASAGPVLRAIEREPLISCKESGNVTLDSIKGRIDLQDVHFRYPSRPDVAILRGLSLSIQEGKTTALVGASGCGKSTVLSLMERFYDPDSGHVLLDGVELRNLDLGWLRNNVGLVSQEPTLFATTVRGNIELGLSNDPKKSTLSASELFERVVASAKKANAHDFITSLPQGYDTVVGEKGALLSGGQKQRIAIARAIVKDPRILLLDEATSALDTSSESIVQAALDAASEGRTTIVVSHRLSTIKNADQIVVLGPQGVLEQGSHKELLSKEKGIYAGMVDAQKILQAEEGKEKLPQESSTTLSILGGGEEPDPSNFTLRKVPSSLSSKPARPSLESLARKVSTLEEGSTPRTRQEGLVAIIRSIMKNGQDRKIWRSYAAGLICSSISGAIYPVYAIVFGISLQNFYRCSGTVPGPCAEPARGDMLREALLNSGAFFIIAIGATFVSLLQVNILTRAGSTVVQRTRHMMFDALLRADVPFFDIATHSSSGLTSSLTDNSQKVYGLLGPTLGNVVQCISTMLIGYIIAIAYGWRLALVVIACSPLTLSAGLLRLRTISNKEEMTMSSHEEATRQASEAVGAIRTVVSFNLQEDCLRRYQEELRRPAKLLNITIVKASLLYAVSQCVIFFAIALAFWYGGHQLMDGVYTSKDFFTILMAVVYGSSQAGNMFNYTADMSNARSAAVEVMKIVNMKPKIECDREKGKAVETVEGGIRLSKVNFKYPSRPDVPILRSLSLEIKPGSFCALVGGSGCGKSTILQLLERFHDAESGEILLDGQNIRSLNLSSLRSQMSLVSQEPTLYDGTIGWNIALGGAGDPKDVTPEQIRKAAEIAQVKDFIESLPEGFETHVSGRGVQLSGGQKQRIAIARAMVRDPKILLLDEATSALDSNSEKAVQKALDEASKGRTTIAIAHRLGTIAKADQIFVLKDGAVAESGTSESLIEKKGIYAEMVRLQSNQ